MRYSNWLMVSLAAGLFYGGAFLTNSKAAERDQGQRPARHKWLETVREKLELTQEQEEKIKATLREKKDTLKDLATALHQARVGLRQAIQGPDANESDVRSAAAKVAGVEADLAMERMKLYKQISQVLSSEQMHKLKELRVRMDEALDKAIERMGKRLSSE